MRLTTSAKELCFCTRNGKVAEISHFNSHSLVAHITTMRSLQGLTQTEPKLAESETLKSVYIYVQVVVGSCIIYCTFMFVTD